MAKIFEIGITHNSSQIIHKVDSVNAIAGKGLLNDRFFKNDNSNISQLTLIEKEKIDYFNEISDASIPYINFRRNIITEGINLNYLVGKKIKISNVHIKVHQLCEPCKHLQDILKQNDLVKNLLHKAGIRCQILNDGKINKGDKIEYMS